jgi:histidine triad (HIT) family protein
MKTIFEQIIAHELPAKRVYEDAHCVAIEDIAPAAPVHILVIPKRRIDRLAMAHSDDTGLLGHLLYVAQKVAQQMGLVKGFRVVINSGPDGAETVPHLHLHVLGGRQLQWPPG